MADTYIEGIGRRKTAVARVRITPADKTELVVNDRPAADYFNSTEQVNVALEPLGHEDVTETFSVSVHASGSGISAQAEAVRLGLARALVKRNEKLRTPLKAEGYLTRDARAVERKKPGLRKARKAAQWSKR